MLDLVSYPRSGSNWVRYFIQHITGLHAIGGEDLPDVNKKEFGKHHGHDKKWFKLLQDSGELYRQILVIRNYKECLYSHDMRSYKSFVDELSEDLTLSRGKTGYMSLLKIHDELRTPKLLIYYEDLINDPSAVFYLIFEFLRKIDYIPIILTLHDFLSNLDEHIQRSLSYYSVNMRPPKSNMSPLYHSQRLTKDARLKIDRFIQSQYPHLYRKYLLRYGEL